MSNYEIIGPYPQGSGPLQRLIAPEYSVRGIGVMSQQFSEVAQRNIDADPLIISALNGIHLDINSLSETVGRIGYGITARMDAQLDLMSRQLSVLESIDSALWNPQAVLASEKARQAMDCLKYGFYDQAIIYAKEAVDIDATVYSTHFTAGWAYLGVNDVRSAEGHFYNSTVILGKNSKITSHTEKFIESLRQLSRCQMVLGDFTNARRNLNIAINQAQPIVDYTLANKHDTLTSLYSVLMASLRYEASIAAAIDNDYESAKEHITESVKLDQGYAQLALGDPLLESHKPVVQHALLVVSEMQQQEIERQSGDQAAEAESQRERERIRKEKELEKQKSIEAKNAKKPELLRRHELYSSFLVELYPWGDDGEPGWATPMNYTGNFNLSTEYTRVRKRLNRTERAIDNSTKGLEEVEATLNVTKSSLMEMANYWCEFQGFDLMGPFARIRLRKIKDSAAAILSKINEQ